MINAISKKVEKIKHNLIKTQTAISQIELKIEKYIDSNNYKKEEYFYALNSYKVAMDNLDRQVNGLLVNCEVEVNKLEDELFNGRDRHL